MLRKQYDKIRLHRICISQVMQRIKFLWSADKKTKQQNNFLLNK